MRLSNVIDATNVTPEPSAAVYQLIAPVPASVRGITVPAAAIEPTVACTVSNVDNTDMRAVAFGERGSAAGLGWQPVTGLKKRHGITRGKPPREPRKGL